MKTASKGVGALGAALALLLSASAPAVAAEPTFYEEFPPGIACDFPLVVAGYGEVLETRIRTDRDGEVRAITAGLGFALRFTNLDTGATVSARSNGGATRTQTNADGTTTLWLTGHNLLILFPTDEPPGPSTILHTGRVVFTIAADESTFIVERVTGQQLDICAALDD